MKTDNIPAPETVMETFIVLGAASGEPIGIKAHKFELIGEEFWFYDDSGKVVAMIAKKACAAIVNERSDASIE